MTIGVGDPRSAPDRRRSGGSDFRPCRRGSLGPAGRGHFSRSREATGCSARGGETGSGQLLAQVVGVATLMGLMLPMTYSLNWLLNRIDPQRVARRGERLGMDMHELGGGAYPEFVIRSEGTKTHVAGR